MREKRERDSEYIEKIGRKSGSGRERDQSTQPTT